MQHIFNAKSLERGLKSAIAWFRLVALQLFQNCFPRISVVFPICFLVFSLPLLLVKKYVSSKLEVNFLFFFGTSLLTFIFC